MTASTLDDSHPASVRIRSLPGVWPPHSDARLLAQALSEGGWARGADVLDMFTGSGALAVTAARLGARSVVAADLSRRALASARLNAWRNGAGAVSVRRTDLFADLGDAAFDVVLANPPYYLGDGSTGDELSRAWAGGDDGRALIDALCEAVYDHLRPGGRLLLVHATFNGEGKTVEMLSAAGLHPQVLCRHRGPFGEVGRAQLERLRARKSVADQETEEETIVISASRPT